LSRVLTRFGFIGIVLAWAGPARANESLPYRARFPVPQSILSQDEAIGDDIASVPAEAGADDDDAVVFEPDLTRAAIRTASSHNARARRPVPINIIRNGFSTRSTASGASPERAVGLKLGADIFSVTTRVIAPPGVEHGRDARIDWRLARPIEAGPGFIWTVSAEGGSGLAARPTQNASVLVGYREQIMEHLTVTSQVAMGGSYVFAPDGATQSELVPELKMTANLGTFAKLPLDAELDVTLARRVPLVASTFETRGSAMLRFKYTLE